jgi:drug/metabolite transporter (DMT)-like permease
MPPPTATRTSADASSMPLRTVSPATGMAIVVGSAALFGMLGPLSRFAYDAGMEPPAFVTWRALVGLLGTAAFVAWRARRGDISLARWATLPGGARRMLLLAATMGFTLNLAMFIAFDRITVALALLGFYTYPAMVAVANTVLGRDRLDRRRASASMRLGSASRSGPRSARPSSWSPAATATRPSPPSR